MKHLIYIGILLILISCGTDSVNKEDISETKNLLTDLSVKTEPRGTQMLNGSKKNNELRWETGLLLRNIEFTPCEEKGEPNMNLDKRISNISRTDSSLTIEFNAIENCCNEFLCEAEFVDDETLNLVYSGFGSFCSCSCCFGFKYEFEILHDGIKDINPEKIKFITIEGDKKTQLNLNK